MNILVREWGHHSATHVTEADYMGYYEGLQKLCMYEDRVKDEMSTCKYFQTLSVSKINMVYV